MAQEDAGNDGNDVRKRMARMAMVTRQSMVTVSATAESLTMRSIVSTPSSTERDLRICRSVCVQGAILVYAAHHHQRCGARNLGYAELL